MTLSLRVCCVLLSASLLLPAGVPTARAASGGDATNEVVAFGLLGAVVGILVYLGWQADKQDRQRKVETDSGPGLAGAPAPGALRWICPPAREGEQIAAVGYGLTF